MDLVPKEYKRQGDIISPPPAPPPPQAGGIGGLAKIKLPNLAKTKVDYIKFGIILAVILLGVSLAAWGGLKFYERSLVSKLTDLQKQEASVFNQQDKITAEKIADLEKRTKVAQDFLKAHVYTSQILNSIASLTLPKVKWDNYGLKVSRNTVALKGKAADYSTLAKQIFTFEQDSTGFSKITVANINLDTEATVSFNISFVFDQKILQK